MALALVGGALLSASLNVLLDRMASRDFIDFFKSGKMNMGILQKLKILLNTVNGVLDDAEDRQMTTSAIKIWLDDLRDAAYEADDVLDSIAYEVTRVTLEAQQQTTDDQDQVPKLISFCNPFEKGARAKDHSEKKLFSANEGILTFSMDLSEKMEEIIERLELLVQQIGGLDLRKSRRRDLSSEREPSTSVVEESGIFGRDGDKEAVVKLLQTDDADGNGIGVVPIVGMGGIGKTTLAQLVYNDSKAHDLFGCRAWVCVSENYDGFRIKRELLKQVNNSGSCDDLTTEQIDVELKKSLRAKRFLLVLDDMWNDSYADWVKLQTPLASGASGSKIIVTTRDERVASIMCTIPSSYQLRELNADSCWLLFAKHAFGGGIVDQRLKAIGEEIVRKCKGLPLAAKMLGGLLRRKRDIAEWEDIVDNNTWDLPNDSILPALRLSYQHLPLYLKQCFAYCAIFPKDYTIKKEEIIPLWMAEGFLVHSRGGKRMEKLGEEYLHELVLRSFLQECGNSKSYFRMHDLINDLAQVISGEFLIRMEGENSPKIGSRSRHLSYMDSKIDYCKILQGIYKSQHLRSFLHWPEQFHLQTHKEFENEIAYNLVPRLCRLRVLSLSLFYTLVELPDSISYLRHLRYLNLGGTQVEKLPETVCTLYNLQTLILRNCYKLVELPKNIGNLVNLHCIDIENTKNLKQMPSRMGNLKDLQILPKYIVGKQNGCDINDLGKLQHVRGKLSILSLENVWGPSNDILKNKKHLVDVKLSWSRDTEDSLHERSLLERLQPYKSIKTLVINGYGGTKFADWVGDSSYANIVSLRLQGCKYCTSLPPLGQLPFLQRLFVSKFDAVVEVGSELFGSSSVSIEPPFSSLKLLIIEDMPQWQDWNICGGNNSVKCESFAKLEELTIVGCPKLKSISVCEPTHKIFKSLNNLEVRNCRYLKTSNLLTISKFKNCKMSDISVNLNNRHLQIAKSYLEEVSLLFNAALCLEKVEITSNTLLECIPLDVIPELRSLSVEGCHKLKSFSASEEPLHQPLMLLASLKIRGCPRLITFPIGGIPAPNLTHLELFYCADLKSLPQRMHVLLPSLLHLVVHGCRNLKSFPEEGLPSSLQYLDISKCRRLIGGRSQWGLQGLSSLSHLSLGCYSGNDLESFPEQTLLPSSLGSLTISCFNTLKFLNYKGLQHLTSLTRLTISGCPHLQCLPEEGLPPSLSVLKIWVCILLKERCEPEKGEDWSKISHISTIEIS